MVSRLFKHWAHLYSMFARVRQERAALRMERENRTRVLRRYEHGEMDYRVLPQPGRPPKGTLEDGRLGLFRVIAQTSMTTITLEDFLTGELQAVEYLEWTAP